MSNYYTKKALSNSVMKHALISLERFKFEWDNIDKPTDLTPALIFGNLVHTLVLEPEEFNRRYAVNIYDGRTKEGKDFKIQADAIGLTIIKAEEYERAKAMVSALTNCQYVDPDLLAKMRFILSLPDFEPEKEIYFTDSATGLECKAKLDGYSREHNLVFDYKTIESLDSYKIQQNFVNYRYDLAVAQYSEAIKAEYGDEKFPTFIFCVQEKQEPYAFKLFTPSESMLATGFTKRAEVMAKLKEAFESDRWYSSTGVEELFMPEWVNK